MSAEDTKRKILASVFDLIEMEPASEIEMNEWYARAEKVKLLLELDKGDLQVPHALWHYLSDADIRLKDRRYAKSQILQLKEALRYWQE